jgi:hypothetical protein
MGNKVQGVLPGEVLGAAATAPTEDSTLLLLFWFAFLLLSFFFYPIFGQRLQLINVLRDIDRKLFRLKLMRDDVRQRTISALKQAGTDLTDEELEKRLDAILDYFYIPPESMDPAGEKGAGCITG